MKQRHVLLKVSLILLFIVGGFHTFFIIIGGPPLPTDPNFLQLQDYMRTLEVDAGGGIMRTTQNFLDGFNIIVSIFLISLPLLSWLMLSEIKDNDRAVLKLTIVLLLTVSSFAVTSFTLLAIGGTVLAAIICLLLITSLLIRTRS